MLLATTSNKKNSWFVLGVLALFVGIFLLYLHLESQANEADKVRFKSLLLSDELRHSSDDLTHMVRSYVATGDTRYKRQFQEILGIRDGTRPRPVGYHHIYWDLVTDDVQRPASYGPPAALITLMKESGITQQELNLLAEGKRHSDVLAKIEQAAMATYESNALAPADRRERALAMLFAPDYYAAKADVMRPIREFQLMVDQRTQEAAQAARYRTSLVLAAFILFLLVLGLMRWLSIRALHDVLGGPADALHGHMSRIGSGDFAGNIHVAAGREASILGHLAVTQTNLRKLEASHAELESELRSMAFHDMLTGLPNRRLLQDRLHHAMQVNARNHEHLAVLFIDLNKFKQLNDSRGHEAGDLLLIQVAQRLRAQLRQSDTVARLGGDEFVVLLEALGKQADAAEEFAQSVAEKIKLALATDYDLNGFTYRGSASVGVRVCDSRERDAGHVLREADAAMYESKRHA